MSPSRIRSTRQNLVFRFDLLILFSIIENLSIQNFSAFGWVGEKLAQFDSWGLLRKWSKFVNMKSSIFRRYETNEFFSVVYQKIEREKLNKINYFHIMFQCTDPELFVKYSHFSHKRCTIFLQCISCHLFILKVPRLNFA